MHSVMKLTLSRLISGRSPGELSAGLKQLLKHYVYLQGTQGNQKKVHVHMCVRTSMMQLFSELFPQECTHGISLGIWCSVNLILMPILIFEMGLGTRLRRYSVCMTVV